jgi:chromosome segregation ATPase
MDTVLQKRFGQDEERDESAGGMVATETMRSATESSDLKKPDRMGEEKISLFWRVFGGTILSIVALVSITLYNSLSSSIAEVRGELNREREARAELVKKDEFNSRTSSQYERMRSYESLKVEQEGLKERISANAAVMEGLKKDSAITLDAVKKELATTSDVVKKDAAALDVFKERVVALEGIKKEIAGIELLKERLTAAAADLKTAREDVARLQQEVERNKAGDNERKLSRDAQFKQVEESLKELQKGMQACREKLARLEGAQPAPKSRGPSTPAESPGPKASATPDSSPDDPD